MEDLLHFKHKEITIKQTDFYIRHFQMRKDKERKQKNNAFNKGTAAQPENSTFGTS